MKLKKEQVYINLQGKSKKELTELWEFLSTIEEKQFVSLRQFLIYCEKWKYYTTESDNEWFFCTSLYISNKQEVTIQQLKEILQPMDLTIEQQLQKAEAEVKRLQSLIEEENKVKVGDWFYFYDDTNKESKVIGKLSEFTTLYYTGDFNFDRCEKITNPELIKLLEQEIK